ncbi:hypothetical protein E6O75_ATG01738 [Venturia nashicola]|uniref:Uncharacterized protein n=1 Tax=Venturia nashicola TaxID=86259 RepID=A0A4Z1NS60_9PEZI|nr:hypothetical protein E6O75_ATG01738 [Venturia nashicola]
MDEERGNESLSHGKKSNHNDNSTEVSNHTLTNDSTTKRSASAIKHSISATDGTITTTGLQRSAKTNTEEKSVPLATENKKRVTFLCLPRELRQQILFSSVPDLAHSIERLETTKNCKPLGLSHAEYCLWWATMVDIHADLEDDVHYVKNTLIAVVDKLNPWVLGQHLPMPIAANEWAKIDKELAARDRTLYEFCDGKIERMRTCLTVIIDSPFPFPPSRDLGSLNSGIIERNMLISEHAATWKSILVRFAKCVQPWKFEWRSGPASWETWHGEVLRLERQLRT